MRQRGSWTTPLFFGHCYSLAQGKSDIDDGVQVVGGVERVVGEKESVGRRVAKRPLHTTTSEDVTRLGRLFGFLTI